MQIGLPYLVLKYQIYLQDTERTSYIIVQERGDRNAQRATTKVSWVQHRSKVFRNSIWLSAERLLVQMGALGQKDDPTRNSRAIFRHHPKNMFSRQVFPGNKDLHTYLWVPDFQKVGWPLLVVFRQLWAKYHRQRPFDRFNASINRTENKGLKQDIDWGWWAGHPASALQDGKVIRKVFWDSCQDEITKVFWILWSQLSWIQPWLDP